MELDLKRIAFKEKYTIGKLSINGKYFCDTIEDKFRILNSYEDKVYGETAIPYGNYKVILSYSNHFKKVLPEILNVEFFKGIRIHSGNTADDSEGCIIVGENKVVGKVINSKKTMEKLMKVLNEAWERKENITIYIHS